MAISLNNRVVIITGGGGFLGEKHAEAVAELEGIPVLADIDAARASKKAQTIKKKYAVPSLGCPVDVTSAQSIERLLRSVIKKFGRVDVLINNAANNPTMVKGKGRGSSRLENFPLEQWHTDIAVGLTGALLCSKIIGTHMAENKNGVIVNISSDLGIIAPDQRIYRQGGLKDTDQPVKPVSYSVVKHGLIGLTKYLATYWSQKGVRVNALCPGGVYDGQPKEFVTKLVNLIPMGRMAQPDEYKGAIQFLCSDASSYMTGQVMIVDGGRTCW